MSVLLTPALQKEWETEFYQLFARRLRYVDFGCQEEGIIYDILEDALDISCLALILTLRFEVRLKEGGHPLQSLSQLLTFFGDLYGISFKTLKGSETRLQKQEGGNFLIKRYEFSLREEFELDIQGYLDGHKNKK